MLLERRTDALDAAHAQPAPSPPGRLRTVEALAFGLALTAWPGLMRALSFGERALWPRSSRS
jgi:hypothetical protein